LTLHLKRDVLPEIVADALARVSANLSVEKRLNLYASWQEAVPRGAQLVPRAFMVPITVIEVDV